MEYQWFKLKYKLNKNEDCICSLCTEPESKPTHIITRTSNGLYNLYSVGEDLSLSKVGSGKMPTDYYSVVFGTKKSILHKQIKSTTNLDSETKIKLDRSIDNVAAEVNVRAKAIDVDKQKFISESKAKRSVKTNKSPISKSKSVGRTSFL